MRSAAPAGKDLCGDLFFFCRGGADIELACACLLGERIFGIFAVFLGCGADLASGDLFRRTRDDGGRSVFGASRLSDRSAFVLAYFLGFRECGSSCVFRESLRMACRVAFTDPVSVFRDGAHEHGCTEVCTKNRRSARVFGRFAHGDFVRFPVFALRRGAERYLFAPFRLGGGNRAACAPHLRVYGEEINKKQAQRLSSCLP